MTGTINNALLHKATRLVGTTRVMTLAVSCEAVPWSVPVYFVFFDRVFYFFSNEHSKHIVHTQARQRLAASIFHDSDHPDQIFGIQMSGVVSAVSSRMEYLRAVKRYVSKFGFLKKVFGSQVIENQYFFKEKFKSQLYKFCPDQVFISDNSKISGKRTALDLKILDL